MWIISLSVLLDTRKKTINFNPYINNGKLNILNSTSVLRNENEVIKYIYASENQSVMLKHEISLSQQGIGHFFKPSQAGTILALIRALDGLETREVFLNVGCNKGECAKGYFETMRTITRELIPEMYSDNFHKNSDLFHSLLIDPNPSSDVKKSLNDLCEEYQQTKYLQIGVGSKATLSDIFISERAGDNCDHEWVITEPINPKNDFKLDKPVNVDRLDNLWYKNYNVNFVPSYMRTMTNGNDLDILESCGSLIKDIKAISLSLNGTAYNFNEIFMFLCSNDFTLLRVTPLGFIVVESERSVIDKCTVYRSYVAIKTHIFREII